MRLHYLLTQDLESPSGLGRYWPLARAIASQGHQITISALHSNYSSLSEHEYINDGVKIFYVSQMHVHKEASNKEYFSAGELIKVAAHASWSLIRQALTISADIIHIAKPHPMNGIAGLAARLLSDRIMFLDCDDYEAGSTRFASAWQRQIVQSVEKNLPRFSRLISTNTLFMKSKLISWGIPESRILYLPNGVDLDRFNKPNPVKVEELRSRLELNSHPVVAYIGTMSLPSHPIDLLIDAFNLVLQSLPNAVLLLVGGGENLPELQRQVEQSGIAGAVRFCGRVIPEDVVNYYALADASVDPVYDDPAARGRSPLKLFESWACGVPFITADVGDRRELIGDPPAGLLCSAGSATQLSEQILEVLRNPQLSQHLVENGRRRLPSFTWESLSKKMEASYQSVLKSR
jgi:glycosyltransferase involved in cell wall biosynthesis